MTPLVVVEANFDLIPAGVCDVSWERKYAAIPATIPVDIEVPDKMTNAVGSPIQADWMATPGAYGKL